MKKILRRIVLLVLGIVICYQHFCYADVEDMFIDMFAIGSLSLIGTYLPIGITVLIIVLVSYFILKREAKKGQEPNEEMTKKINFSKKLIFIIIAILVIMINFCINYIYEVYYPKIFLVSISVLIILAIILRLKEKKKIAYIIMTIAIMMIGIITTYSHILKKEAKEEWKERFNAVGFATDVEINVFNEKFTQYEGKEVKGSIVRALIQQVVSNNAGNTDDEVMQVTVSGVVTLNKEDTQLPEQFDEIKWDKTYNVNMIYNKYGKIESIHIEENQ